MATKELETVYAVIDKWLYMPDKVPVDVILATKLGLYLKSDPIWLMVLGASGSGKTELIRALKDSDSYLTHKLTAKSFISGLRQDGKKSEQEEIDLLPKLHQKTLLIPDLGNILTLPDYERSSIFTALQDCYDGEFSGEFGSVGHKSGKARFGFICGTTEVIDSYIVKFAAFGQRFVRIMLSYSDVEKPDALNRAIESTGEEGEMRTEISQAIKVVLDKRQPHMIGYNKLEINPAVRHNLEALCTGMSALHTGVLTDPRTGRGNYIPHQSTGLRAVKQFTSLGRALACLYQHDEVGNAEYEVLTRVAIDSIPEIRLQIVRNCSEWVTARDLSYAIGVRSNWIYSALDELYALKVLEIRDAHAEEYRVRDYWQEIFTAARFQESGHS